MFPLFYSQSNDFVAKKKAIFPMLLSVPEKVWCFVVSSLIHLENGECLLGLRNEWSAERMRKQYCTQANTRACVSICNVLAKR